MNTKIETPVKQVEFTKISHDINGNPRYVFHFLELINEGDRIKCNASRSDTFGITSMYEIALIKAREMGGRKFHNKQYGGGIVIQSYHTQDDENTINKLKEVNSNFISEFTKKDFTKLEKAIYSHFARYEYKFRSEHGKEGAKFTPLNFDSVDALLGLAYTSGSSCAGYWVCNSGYLMVNDTHHFTGFTINTDGKCIAICHDERENQILIEL